MDDQHDQDELDDIVVEDAASEPTGCLGQAVILTVIVGVLMMRWLR
jgi:hypothetical protein